ncbi:PDGLE domain-containing protein [Phycicoccus sp. BSK3Z-2]|uniref:PDGLE domain-containing protein n=1 Tax=Phycicoccus avicenniae TaxID=2828860 RepID=A0A941D544_9MICO|nr:PDGLE domain-containing protein [Phycicoccus avicenniae]MBR7742274.1 PDGLE domain-containing protein [Phycicoccus avicenniae]
MSTPTSERTPSPTRPRVTTRVLVLVGLGVSLLVAGLLSFWASGHPDGLEFVAGSLGFEGSARDSATAGSPFADYGTEGVSSGLLSGGLAGVVGVVVTAVVMFGLVALLRRRSSSRD